MPDSKLFNIPFGTSGDKATIPEATQPSGAISFQQGFGPDYERDPGTDPLAKRVPRDETNELYYQITNSLKFLQIYGAPEWYAVDDAGTPVSYPLSARVRHPVGGTMRTWQSLVANNTAEPGSDASKWAADEAGWNYGAATGTNALVVAVTPALPALVIGSRVTFKAANNSTGVVTLNVNGLGAQPVFSMPDIAQVGAGDILAGRFYDVIFGGDGWYLFTPATSKDARRGIISGNEIRELMRTGALRATTKAISAGQVNIPNNVLISVAFQTFSDDGQSDWTRSTDQVTLTCQRAGRYLIMGNFQINLAAANSFSQSLSSVVRLNNAEFLAASIRVQNDELNTTYGGGVEIADCAVGTILRGTLFQDNTLLSTKLANYRVGLSIFRLTPE